MTTVNQKRKELLTLLDSYGCRFNSTQLGHMSEMAYSINLGTVTISDDIDLNDVFEGIEKIEGMRVINSWEDSGFNTTRFPVKKIIFE